RRVRRKAELYSPSRMTRELWLYSPAFIVITCPPPTTSQLLPVPRIPGAGRSESDLQQCKRSLPTESPRSCRHSEIPAHKVQKNVECLVADIVPHARIRERAARPRTAREQRLHRRK